MMELWPVSGVRNLAGAQLAAKVSACLQQITAIGLNAYSNEGYRQEVDSNESR